MKKVIPLLLAALLLAGCASAPAATVETTAPVQTTAATEAAAETAPVAVAEAPVYTSRFDSETVITLSDDGLTVNGGGETDTVYTSHDIVYYEEKNAYESGNPYGVGSKTDMHTAEEAQAHTVVNITAPGAYRLSGKLSAGQIRIDLGEDAASDPDAVVELILDGADITCTVAPAILFRNVYECDGGWNTETAQPTVDTADAGANLILAENSRSTVSGSYVAKIYKDAKGEKKLWKQDGAVYSYMSMNVYGPGALDITAENEGLDTELHLTINGGDIRITSGDDGINTNEDGVSVTTVNGGTLTVNVTGAMTGEGDGIDSNGWLVINGGTAIAAASAASGLDSDMGIYLNGGTVIASGSMLDEIAQDSAQTYAAFSFAQTQPGGETYTLKDESGETVLSGAPVNAFSQLLLSSPDLTEGTYTFWQGETQLSGAEGGGMGMGGQPGGMPDGQEPPDGEAPQSPADGGTPPERPEDGNAPADGQQPPAGSDSDGQEPPAKPEDGEMPSPPDGADGQQPPEPPEGVFPGGASSAEASTDFPITVGANRFSQVGPAEMDAQA
mgnify:CR=1 FL=1